jgi:hypothetical protein
MFLCASVYAQDSHVLISVSAPYVHDRKLYQDLFINKNDVKISSVTIACYDVTNPSDSIKVYAIKAKGVKSKRKEAYYADIQLSTKEKGSVFQSPYEKILQKNTSLPAGDYCTYVTIRLKDSVITRSFIHHIDSLLGSGTAAHKEFENIYNPGTKKSKFTSAGKKIAARISTPTLIKKYSKKVDKTFKSKGFEVSYREVGTKTYADVAYQGRFVGYYEMDKNESVEEKIERQRAMRSGGLTPGFSNKLENNGPVFSRMKELYKDKKKNEAVGNISLTGNMASGQEEYSQNENNYFELAGQVEVPIKNIPVQMEAYYTSQDNNRIAKASYFRVHYDSEQAKSQLMQMISGYRNKYDEAAAGEGTLKSIYGSYISRLKSEKGKLMADVMAETGIADPGKFKVDTTGLFKEITAASEKRLKDSLGKTGGDEKGKAQAAQRNAKERYDKAMEKYRKAEEMEQKIQHYNTLLEQYRTNNYFDSLMAYDKLKDVEDADNKSYKQLAKKAGDLLPEGDAKKFIAGVTNFDAGIFSKQLSAYTINGQNIKGFDVGYDIGFCETGFTYGRVEYVSRDGQLDKYTGYSARTKFKTVPKQTTSLIYYGYMPSKSMLTENEFFKEMNSYMPAFKTPIHIFSIVQSGSVTKHVNMEAEAATSFRSRTEFVRKDVKLGDKMAYRLSAEGAIPQTNVGVTAGYEHVGKQFENNTLPLNLSGTDKYTAGAKSTFFKNFLGLAVEYNYLVQQNFASKSSNSKWGFEVKTTSKRYPSASLSYRPFATYRSFADTFNVPQRPIIGEVWLGKLSYQLKNKIWSLRLTAIYNKNTAMADTVESNSNVAQLNALYTRGKTNFIFNAGQTDVKANTISAVHGKTKFLSLSASHAIDEQWSVNGGQDIGLAKTGLCRYAVNAGCGYRFKKLPLALQTSFRYNTYRMAGQGWKNIYSGMVDLNWQFRFKVSDKL